MKSKFLIIIPLVLIAFFFLLPEPEGTNDSQSQPQAKSQSASNLQPLSGDFIIRNVQLYDGTNQFEKVDVLVQDFRLAEISRVEAENLNFLNKDVPEIDGTGKTLLPGLIDSHTHAYMNALSEALNFGVTTELDMFTMPEFANAHQQKRDDLNNTAEADLFSATILATAPGGHGTEYGFEIPVLENSDQVDTFVKQRVNQGADYIKAVYNSEQSTRKHFPSISHDTLKALIESAHQHNKLLVVHIDNLVSAREAIELGADGIIHSFMDQLADEAFVQLMLDKQAFIIPTLTVQASVTQQSTSAKLLQSSHHQAHLSKQQSQQLKASFPDFGIPPQALQNAMASVKKLADAGVPILAGSDAPNPGTTHGLSLHAELELLAQAGLSNEQVLHAATAAAGKYFPIGNRGKLLEGQLATMILVDGNPLENISDTQRISRIWKNGVEFARVKVDTAQANNAFSPGMINNFDQQIYNTEMGTGIGETTDQFAGGQSVVELSLIKDSEKSDNQFLKVSGEVKSGFMFPWSGFSYLLGENQQTGVDLSKIKSLRFRAKGGPHTAKISVLLFQTGSFRPIQKDLKITDSWQEFDLVLSDVKNLDTSDIANISIVRAQAVGDFEFFIDELRFE